MILPSGDSTEKIASVRALAPICSSVAASEQWLLTKPLARLGCYVAPSSVDCSHL
jgi:hypothetical protein